MRARTERDPRHDERAPDPRIRRLAIFISDMGRGGAQRAMLNVAQGVARRGHPVDLVLSRARGPRLADVPAGVRVVDLNASRVLASGPALVRYLRRERPAAMLSALNYVNVVALLAWRVARVPTRLFVSERNQLSAEASHASASRLGIRFMPRLVRHLYPWADGIVTVSMGVADDLARLMNAPRERIDVIYNPVVTPELRRKAAAALAHPWFAPGQPPVVLAVGRLSPQKDFATLIRAFAEARRGRRARLLILGEGHERPALERLIRALDLEADACLPGFVENPHPYMVRSALFVLSSRWEGLPGVLIEALYCGVPVVSTDCPSGPREILEDGAHGELVPVAEVPALARAISGALDGRIQRPTRASWARFEEDTALDRYVDLLLAD